MVYFEINIKLKQAVNKTLYAILLIFKNNLILIPLLKIQKNINSDLIHF